MKYMKIVITVILSFLLCGCASAGAPAQIAANTLPVW